MSADLYIEESKGHCRQLSKAEEIAAWRRGDLETLMLSQLAWVVRLAARINRRYQLANIEVLISAGNLALAHCVRSYDATRSRLTTYAHRRICWAMHSELRTQARGLAPTRRMRDKHNAQPIVTYGDDTPQIASDQNLLADVIRNEEAGLVRAAIDGLPEREAAVIRGRYFEHLKLSEIGLQLGITKERVRQIESRAKRMLRERLQGSCNEWP